MKSLVKVVLVLGGLSLFACNGFNNDPFAAKDDAIKNAKEALPKPVRPTAISSDIVSLDVTNNVVVSELVPMTFELRLKSLLSGYSYGYEIQNSDLFPGATIVKKADLFPNDLTIDPNILVLTWTPKAGIVPSTLNYKQLIMSIAITAYPTESNPDQTVLQAAHSMTFLVEPIITGKVESTFGQGVTLIAGEMNTIPFMIFDNKNKSILKLIAQNNFPPGAKVSCQETPYSFQQCQLEWTPNELSVGIQFTSSIGIRMKTMNPSSIQTAQQTVNLSYTVKAKE